MDRRTNSRMELQLVCHVGPNTVLSRPVGVVTENVSRHGMLMRWTSEFPLPAIGARLQVDVDLPPAPGFGPRVMQCRTTVIRIVPTPGSEQDSVALHIDSMRFAEGSAGALRVDLRDLPPASGRVN